VGIVMEQQQNGMAPRYVSSPFVVVGVLVKLFQFILHDLFQIAELESFIFDRRR
jgi:hypothetical protein